MSDNGGGSAFPAIDTEREADQIGGESYARTYSYGGMSLRDYFAAQVLPALMRGDHTDGQGDPERHAAMAYKYADAMLEERE